MYESLIKIITILIKEYSKVILLYIGVSIATILIAIVYKYFLDPTKDLTFLGMFLFKGILGPVAIFFPYYLTKFERYDIPIIGLALVIPFVRLSQFLHEKIYTFCSEKIKIEISSYINFNADPSGSLFMQIYVLAYFSLSLLILPYIVFKNRSSNINSSNNSMIKN